MKERPILFNAPMVRAILEGRKTMTRRVVKPQIEEFKQHTPDKHSPKHPKPYLDAYCGEPKTSANPRGVSPNWHWWTRDNRPGECVAKCHYGQPGDRLWVRETWGLMCHHDPSDWCAGSIRGVPESELVEQYSIEHAANWNLPSESAYWRPSIFMPRWASRITLEVADVRVQRVQDITEEDAKAEGVDGGGPVGHIPTCLEMGRHRYQFCHLWDSINSKRGFGWDSNPWVWAITFKQL